MVQQFEYKVLIEGPGFHRDKVNRQLNPLYHDQGHGLYKVVQIRPGLFVCKQVTVCPGHIRTTLYKLHSTVRIVV
jgi:hypothetical protein